MSERVSSLVHRRNVSPLQAFGQAVALHDQGRLAEAEQLYKRVLDMDDRHFAALCRLGLIRLQQGSFPDAERLFRRAIKLDRNSADGHHALACALTGLGQHEEAVRAYEKALAIRPDFPEAHNNLGHELQKLGRFEHAVARFRKALAIRPDYPEAHNNIGNALCLLERSEEAIGHFEQALAARPDYVEAYWNLGNALRARGRPEEAIARYEKLLAIRPNHAEAHNALGNTLRMLGRTEEAIAHYERAIAIRPDYAEAHLNLGDVLGAISRHQEAIQQYDAALAIRPGYVEALYKRGNAFIRFKRHNEALASFEEALSLEPEHPYAFQGLALSAAAACDWTRAARLGAELTARVEAGKLVEPFTFLHYASDPSLQLACAKTFVAHQVPTLPPPLWKGTVWRDPKIKIAYVSCGFHQHPTAYLTAELLELHDRSRFEIIGISLGPDDGSEIRARLVRAFDQFHDVRSESDSEVAALINDLRVDIVVDRSGYTANARPGIFAHRPAPIQVSYIGFPGTLGAEHYDYVIADPIVLPFDQQAFYTEKIVHLPECYLVSDSKRASAKGMPTREDEDLPARGFVFCCFNQNYKITAQMFSIWMRLLRRVDGSVLWLLRDNAAAEDNLRREAAALGIDPARLVFAPRRSLAEHLARHRLADLFLDTLPYNAHTTGSDALWIEVPLVTCRGQCFAGRVAASLLQAVGLPELVCDSLETYEALALRLATDPTALTGVKQRLQQNRLTYPLFDTERYRRHIEAAYTKMWDLWQEGESPQSFAVEPLDARG